MPSKLSLEDISETVRLREQGLTFDQIGVRLGLSSSAIARRLRPFGEHKLPTRECALAECSVVFQPRSPNHRCCSRLHVKRQHERERVGCTVYFSVCALPECAERTLVKGAFGKFCSRSHYETHLRRVGLGFYQRLFGVGDACVACGEVLVVEEHNVVYDAGGSKADSPTVWLCPTHHQAVHRGLAKIVDGEFISTALDLAKAVKEKHPDLVPELPSGNSWDAKG